MTSTAIHVVTVVLFISCFASFAWGMRYFFVQPTGFSWEMRLTAILGIVSVIAHLLCLLVLPGVTPARELLGSAMYLASLALFWSAIAANRKQPLSAVFATDLPVHLVQQGPYRFLRHPFYASYLIAWTAGVVATANPWLALTVVLMFVLYMRASGIEERKFASSRLAGDYEAYRECTGRFVPNFKKLIASQRPTRQRSHEAA